MKSMISQFYCNINIYIGIQLGGPKNIVKINREIDLTIKDWGLSCSGGLYRFYWNSIYIVHTENQWCTIGLQFNRS
jgi:hypothetical protein